MERVYRVTWKTSVGSREFLGRYFAESGEKACERARREYGIESWDGHVYWQLFQEDQAWVSA